MKTVIAFVGSARKKNTYHAVEQFLNNLQKLGDVEYEIVVLSRYNLGICRGCQLCTSKGEAFCPLKDDRDVLFDKISASDGVVFASPNYTWNLSGMMKVFLDRFGFAVHRPRFFGKAFTSIVTQAMGRGDKIVEYFDYTAFTLGFNTLKGITTTGFDPKTEKQQKKIDLDLAKHSQRFYRLLVKPAYPVPTLFQLLGFRMSRTMIRQTDPGMVDHQYYAGKGWFESDYYYATSLGTLKRAIGSLADRMAPAVQKLFA
jgi:multimeric flavodoxin WrbA